jgi:outer membrane protein assembly factor BamB
MPPPLVSGGDAGLHAYDPSGKVLWELPTGMPVRHVQAADLNGDGLAEVVATTEGGYVFAADQKGKVVWERGVGAAPAALLVADLFGDDKPEVLVWCVDGMLHALDATGRRVAALNVPGAPRFLLSWPGPERRVLAIGNEGSVSVIEPG